MKQSRDAADPSPLRPVALALAVFGIALGLAFQGHLGADFHTSVPVPARALVEVEGAPARIDPVTQTDYRMGVWAFGRHAYTLWTAPWRIFQTEPCHPVENGLALHHPVITQGLLAMPAYLVSGDPLATTNWLILFSALLGACAMALLVADWTALPAAGVVAGLLYAFHPAQIGSPFHLGTKDFTWTLLALFFARRLFQHGRWRDALGLGACAALQMATSFYPLLAAATLAVPFLVWLVWHHGWRRLPLSRLGVAALVAALAAWWIFAPYLELREAGILQRNLRFFAPWSRFAPGGELFPGWLCLGLLAAAFALGRSRSLAGMQGDPRAALAIGAFLLLWLATGGNVEARSAVLKGAEPPAVNLPNLFAAARAIVPGLDSVRLPSMLAHGARMLLCVLAGLGAAALLRRVPGRYAAATGALLILLAALDTLQPSLLGGARPVRFASLDLRPPESTLAFYARLEALGNDGPMLELPMTSTPMYRFEDAPMQHLLTAFHHRRTSGCSPSYTPPVVQGVAALAGRIERPGSLAEVRDLGFTTLVVHHPPGRPGAERYAVRIARLARRSRGDLVEIASAEGLTAYALRARERAAAGQEGQTETE